MYGHSDMPVEQINNTTGAVLYLHHDQQGSTRLLTGSTGKAEATFTYGPYGTLTGSTGTATTPLGFDAQYTNSDTGLIYLRARSYDPATGQFLSVDPLASLTGAPYNYAADNPINLVDPRGLEAIPFPVTGPQDLSACVDPVTAAICAAGGIYAVKELYDAFAGEEAGNDEGEAELKEKEAEREKECGGNGRNPAQDKKLSPGQIKKLKEAGFDPHELKEGGQGTDLYVDRDGNIYEKPIGGAGPGEPTGINIKELE
jgi:RHS repeat-associated protein